MARDGKLVFRFSQVAEAANIFGVQNYGASATASTGAFIGLRGAAGTASVWYRGASNALNRSGFRQTNADQTLLVSGETSALAGDPAMTGDTSYAYEYVRIRYAPVGPLNAVADCLFEVALEAASDSGTGTAGTDWVTAGSAVPINPIASYATVVSTAAGVVAGVVNTSAAHGLSAGQVLFARVAGTNFAQMEPLFVVPRDSTSFGLTKTPGSGVIDTTLSTAASAQTFDRAGTPRIITLPLNINTKPWVRVAFRALPNSTIQVARYAGLWLDNVFLTKGRDSAAAF